MRETILALLALSVVTTMSIGVMSASLQNSIKQVDREIEVYSSAVAANVLDYAGSRSFDSRTTPESWDNSGSPSDSTQFDASSSFGSNPDCNLYEPYNDVVICDDVGDLHMESNEWQPYQYVVEVVDGDSLIIPFEVNTRVQYIDLAYPDSTLPSYVRTNTKRITVKVKSKLHDSDNRSGGLVTIERIYAYNGDVAAKHHQASVEVCTGGDTIRANRLLVPIYEKLGGSAGPC